MADKNFFCSFCGNTDPNTFGIRNGKLYCRKCISFRGEELIDLSNYPKPAPLNINYNLSNDQKRLSQQLLDNYKKGINTLVHAVCGSGKTEIVLALIKYAINCGEKVGFAIPRRDVVVEICERFKQLFSNNKVVAVYGGNTEQLDGDLLVLTTHQLFRYKSVFDLLIIDEIDAFPFKNNEVLNSFFEKSVKGHYVMMSATPSEDIIKKFKSEKHSIVELFSRYHGHALPVPKLIIQKGYLIWFSLAKHLRKYLNQNKPVFIFVPTIDKCEIVYKVLSIFFKNGNYVHSKKNDRSDVIKRFKNGGYKFLITTAVLERGVTVKNLQVIVFGADSDIYDSATLIQIAGRVGRKIDAPEGDVLFIANETNKAIENAISEIKRANQNL